MSVIRIVIILQLLIDVNRAVSHALGSSLGLIAYPAVSRMQ